MNGKARMKSFLCLLLALLLALPQCVNVSAEETETEESYTQTVSEEESAETEGPKQEDASEVIEFETEEESETAEDISQEEQTETAVLLSEDYVELHAGDRYELEAYLEGTEEGYEIVWSCDAPDIVSVDENGSILALQEGIANITASVEDGSLFANAIVKVLPQDISSVVFEQNSYELNAGETLTVPYEASEGRYEDIIWSVDGEEIIKVDFSQAGQLFIEAVSGGVAQINAQIDGFSKRISVVVLEDEEMDVLSHQVAASQAGSSTVTGTYSLTYNQTSARDLAVKLNCYRVDTAQISALTYDFTLEKYAMQRVAEIVLSFEHIRPDGSIYHTVFDKSIYGSESTTNLKENLLCTGGGAMSTSLQVLNRVLDNNTQRTNSLRTKNRSFGISHAVYNGIDYWVMLFSDTPAVNRSQSSALDGEKDVSVRIGSNLYSSLNFVTRKSELKVNVGKTVSLPSVIGLINVVLGGKQKSIGITGFSVSWSMDAAAKKYASISNGKVVAKNEPNNDEKAYLIATPKLNGAVQKEVKVLLKVVQPVTGVEVLPKSAGVDQGDTYQMTAIVSPNNASDKTVTWKSSNTKIATVSAKGLVTGKKGGTCTITAVTNDGGFKASCNVTVIVKAEGIAFDVDELTMSVDMEDKLVPVFTPADTTDKRVRFTSSDPSKVKVEGDTITALAATGNDPVIITVTALSNEGLTAELQVTVKEKDRAAKPSASFLYESTYEVPAFDYDEDGEKDILIKGDKIKLHTDTKDALIYYTLDGSTPDTGSRLYTGMIEYEGGDLTVKAVAVKQPQMKDSVVATFKFEEGNESTWEILDEDLEKLKGDDGLYHIPSGMWAVGVDETVEYTGNKIIFPNYLDSETADDHYLRVYHRNHLLVIKQDYTLTYKNNMNVCPEGSSACEIAYQDDGSYVPARGSKAACIMITGKGNYTGNTYIPFKIVPAAISEENGFRYQDKIYVSLTNKAVSPLPVITWNGKKLRNKTDYVITYSKDPNGSQILEGGIKDSDLPEGQDHGVFYAVIKGVNNFTNGKEPFAVPIYVKKNAKLFSKANIKIQDMEYSGKEIAIDELAVSVTSGKETLEKGKDYILEKVSPEPIKEIGTYSVTVKATDESEFIGEKTVSFKLTGKMLTKAKVFCLATAATYKGDTFAIKDLYKPDSKHPELNSVTLFYGDEKLVEGKDYTVQIDGQNKGKGTIRFVGMGSYTGILKRNFTINPLSLSKEDLFIYTTDVSFTKSGARPEVFIFLKTETGDPTGYEISDGIFGKYLYEGEDYTLKFVNNRKIYTDSEFKTKNAPSVTIVMKGNYKGTFANNYFLILSEDISYMQIEAADIVYAANKKGAQYYVKPVITDYEGKKLTVNKDYELTYYYAQDAKVNGSSTYNRAYGTPVREGDVPQPGTVIGVRADGIGSYYGSLSTEYKVYEKTMNLSSASVKIDYRNDKKQFFDYTGAQIVPTAENLKVTLSKKELIYGVDYEILSLGNNVKAGKATMVLRGLGGYGGTKKVTYNIGRQSIILDIGNLFRKLLGL